MKQNKKAALNIKKIVVFITLWPLCGCADVSSLNWLTGEPDFAALSSNRMIKVPDSNKEKAWPHLAAIPQERPDFSSMADRKEQVGDLVSDKLQTNAEVARIQNIDVLVPAGQQRIQEQDEDDNFPQKSDRPFSALTVQ